MKNGNLENCLRIVVAAIGTASSAGCSSIVTQGGITKRAGPLMSDRAIAPVPVPSNTQTGDDPAAATYNDNEQKRFECEQAHYNAALKAEDEERKIPEMKCGNHKEPDLVKQQDYLHKKHETTHLKGSLAESRGMNKELADALKKDNQVTVSNHNSNSDNSETEVSPTISVSPGSIKDFNQKKHVLYYPNLSLSLEDQYAICNETERGKTLADFVGEVRFNDCDYDPKKAKGMKELAMKVIGEGETFLYCGETDPRSADQCPSRHKNDRANLGLSWDRAYNIGKKCEERAPKSVHVGFANGINGKRATRVYQVKGKR